MAVQEVRCHGELEDGGPGVPEDHDAVEVLFSGVGELDFEDGLDCWGEGEV